MARGAGGSSACQLAPEPVVLRRHEEQSRVGNILYLAESVEPNDDFKHLDHIDFPYNAGDVLLIASEGQGDNKIEWAWVRARKNFKW